MNFRIISLFLLSGCLVLAGCKDFLKKQLDNADLAQFRDKNQAHIDSLLRGAAGNAAAGVADSAKLISQNLILGLKGSMDTLDPDIKKIMRTIDSIGNLSDAQLNKLGDNLERRLKNLKSEIKDEELTKFVVGMIEESTGKLKKETRTLLSNMIQEALASFDEETAKEKLQLIVRGVLDDSTKTRAQMIVNGALQPTMDTLLARIDKIVHKDVPFVQKQAKKLLFALAALAAAIIGWVWYQRRRYARLVALLTYNIDKMPSQSEYDELTKRIRNEAQKNELEPLLRQVLKEQGVNVG
ncbi:MAG: hypothetical protein SFV22_07245 [Saprospiraceae bacterium]|nr:hypothetical protein [Saprospiraceae bacterium]